MRMRVDPSMSERLTTFSTDRARSVSDMAARRLLRTAPLFCDAGSLCAPDRGDAIPPRWLAFIVARLGTSNRAQGQRGARD
jgi:hypothetical protein